MENRTKPYITEAEISEIEVRMNSVKASYRRRQRAYEEIEQGGDNNACIME